MDLLSPGSHLLSSLQAGHDIGADGFVAIDFETATRSRASACSLGMAIVEDGEITKVKRWLFKPPRNEYLRHHIVIHGITPYMTMHSPTMGDAWPYIMNSIGGRPLVAHSAAFDMGVLRGTLEAYDIEVPDLQYLCTCTMSRRAFPGMKNYKLSHLASQCGFTFNHHEAGDDAAVAAELAIACCGRTSKRTIEEAAHALGLPLKPLIKED